MNFQDINWLMGTALLEAEKAYNAGEVPVGAVVVDSIGSVLAATHNLKERNKDASAHAEILALQTAAKKTKDWRLNECTLIVTLEPCPMCMAALNSFRIKKLIFGAYDPKGGALSLGYHTHKDSRLNHRFEVVGGVMHYECSSLISKFFKERREQYQNIN